MTYYIYHIPGKKIGVTCDLNNRVTVQQGYSPKEYEVLDSSTDIDYISTKELMLQKLYGYRVDMVPYRNLKQKKNMNLNVTEQTTTFPCPVNKLKGKLFDMIGYKWTTEHGEFLIDPHSIAWIMDNVKTSMFNNSRCYVYNKAFAVWTKKAEGTIRMSKPVKKASKKRLKIFNDIRSWAKERGLYDKGNSHTQYVKLQEEAGELAKALLNNDQAEITDAIGDMVVVLTNLAHLECLDIEECIATAYNVISKRKGKMVNGTFVKDED